MSKISQSLIVAGFLIGLDALLPFIFSSNVGLLLVRMLLNGGGTNHPWGEEPYKLFIFLLSSFLFGVLLFSVGLYLKGKTNKKSV